MNEIKVYTCRICGLEVETTFHHYIPVTLHTNKKFKKLYEKNFLKTHGINLCKTCHKTIHQMFSEKELGIKYNSYQKLLSNEKFRHYVHWIRKRNEK